MAFQMPNSLNLGRRSRQYRRLRTVVVIVLSLGVLLQAALLIALGYWGAQKAIVAIVGSVHRSDHLRIENRVEGFLKHSMAVVNTLTEAPHLEAASDNSKETAVLLWSLLNQAPQLDSLYVADDKGHMLQARRYPEPAMRSLVPVRNGSIENWDYKMPENPALSPRQRYVTQRSEVFYGDYDTLARPWYRLALGSSAPVWTHPYVFATAQELGVTFVARQMQGSSHTQRERLVAADVSLSRLSEFVREFSLDGHGHSALLGPGQQVLARSDGLERISDLSRPQDDFFAAALALVQSSGNPEEMHRLVHGNNHYLVYSSVLPYTGWMLVSWVSENTALGDLRQGARFVALFALLFWVLVLVFTLRLTRKIVHPIERLAHSASLIGQMRLKEIEPVSTSLRELVHLDKAIQHSVRVLRAFVRFAPVDVVKRLIAQGHSLRPSGQLRQVTVMFVDVQGFSALAEQLEPEQLVRQTGAYFQLVSDEVTRRGGTIDKFLGDGVMVLWGAPNELDEPGLRACCCALNIMAAMDQLNASWVAKGWSPFKVNIGIHSGSAVLGLFGSNDRLAYTALGDTVNAASRIEGVNRQMGTRVLVSDPVQKALANRLSTRPMGSIFLRGRSEPLRLWELNDAGSICPVCGQENGKVYAAEKESA